MSNIEIPNNSLNLLRVILWQYNTSPNLRGLLEKKQDWYNENQNEFWDNWLTDVFDLRTANDFGLSVWAVILDVPLFEGEGIDPPSYPAWGFGAFGQNFDNGNFASDGTTANSLTTEQKRIVLQLRYFSLTCDCTPPTVNKFLKYLLGDGYVYLKDNLDMTIEYVFSVALDPGFKDTLIRYDILPRPSAVAMTITEPP